MKMEERSVVDWVSVPFLVYFGNHRLHAELLSSSTPKNKILMRWESTGYLKLSAHVILVELFGSRELFVLSEGRAREHTKERGNEVDKDLSHRGDLGEGA